MAALCARSAVMVVYMWCGLFWGGVELCAGIQKARLDCKPGFFVLKSVASYSLLARGAGAAYVRAASSLSNI